MKAKRYIVLMTQLVLIALPRFKKQDYKFSGIGKTVVTMRCLLFFDIPNHIDIGLLLEVSKRL